MKTLKTIQTISKVAKVISKIVFILCIIGCAGCILGIVSLAVIPDGFKVGEVTLHSIIEDNAEMNMGTMYTSMAMAIFICAGEAVLAKFAELYFKNELKAGTPFTLDGAKELMRLGILTVCIPIGAQIIAGIVGSIMVTLFNDAVKNSFELSGSVGLGVMFIVMSLLCRYGAEITGHRSEE